MEKIVQARKRSEDPRQEYVREQKAQWNARVSQFISKVIALKRAMNGKGDDRIGLPSSNIKNPMPPEVSSYLHGLAAEFATLTTAGDGIANAQNQYSVNRRRGKKEAGENMEDGFVVQASWWGSRLWSHLGLRALPKEIRKLRLELLRSANYMHEELNHIEDKLYSTDIAKNTSGINQLSILSFGFLRSFLRQYNQLAIAYKNQGQAGVDVSPEKKLDEVPTKEEEIEEGDIKVPQEEPKDKLKWHIEAVNYIKWQLNDAQQVINFITKKISEFNVDRAQVLEINKTQRLLHSETQRFSAASKQVGAEDVLRLEDWAKDLVARYKQMFQMVFSILKEKIDLSSVKENDFSTIMKIVLGINEGYPPSSTPKEPVDLSKSASGLVSRWVNRKLLRLSPSAENDIKLSVTDYLIKVIHKFDEIMDIIEDKDSPFTNINSAIIDLAKLYTAMLTRLQVLAKIVYLKQDEIKFNQKEPILKLKGSIVRDIGTIINELEMLYSDKFIRG